MASLSLSNIWHQGDVGQGTMVLVHEDFLKGMCGSVGSGFMICISEKGGHRGALCYM